MAGIWDELPPDLDQLATEERPLTVSEFIGSCNNLLEMELASVEVVGEVSSFKVSQGKWVFFDLKDDACSVGCFMTLWNLRMPLEDGMKVRIEAVPKLTNWGKFSLTVQRVVPVGEGNLKKSFELLKKKLAAEGLFDPAKKRPLPDDLSRIGVISSTQAAGYADFIKIVNERWGGLEIQVAHTGVQGLGAADQIIRALRYLNERQEVQVVAIIRGGGSADDLAVFNDEQLVRVVATSRIPVITGIGHEVDESLVDLAADLQGSTPSNVAQMLTKDRRAEIAKVRMMVERARDQIVARMPGPEQIWEQMSGVKRQILTRMPALEQVHAQVEKARRQVVMKLEAALQHAESTVKLLEKLNPQRVLEQGYSIVTGKLSPGEEIRIIAAEAEATATVKQVKERK